MSEGGSYCLATLCLGPSAPGVPDCRVCDAGTASRVSLITPACASHQPQTLPPSLWLCCDMASLALLPSFPSRIFLSCAPGSPSVFRAKRQGRRETEESPSPGHTGHGVGGGGGRSLENGELLAQGTRTVARSPSSPRPEVSPPAGPGRGQPRGKRGRREGAAGEVTTRPHPTPAPLGPALTRK